MATEFDPMSERHFTILTIKMVEPGCTTELQLELRDGTMVRLTTTEDPDFDERCFEGMVRAAFKVAYAKYMAAREPSEKNSQKIS